MGRLTFGGVEHWLRDVVRSVDPDRFRMDFVVEDDTIGYYEQELEHLGATIHRVPSHRNPVAYANALFRILTRGSRFDAVHCHQNLFSALPLLVAWAARVPIRVCHSHTTLTDADTAGSIPRRLYVWIARAVIRLSATDLVAVTAASGTSLYGYHRGWRRKVAVIRCGIPLAPYRPQKRDRALALEFGIDPDAFVIAQVGRLAPVKNHEVTIAAMAHVARLMPDAVALMVGEGALRPALEAQVKSSMLEGRVVFLGARDDVPRILSGLASVVVLPSSYEGLPIVALEAQAAGIPLLTSEAVTREGDVVEPLVIRLPVEATAQQWAEAIVCVRDAGPTDEDRMRAHVAMEESEFSLQRSVAQLESVYARSA